METPNLKPNKIHIIPTTPNLKPNNLTKETQLKKNSILKQDILLDPTDIKNDIYYIVHILRKLKDKFDLDENKCQYISTVYNYIKNPNGMYIKFYYDNFTLHISIFNSDKYDIDKSVWGPVHLTLEYYNIKLARISNIGYVNIYDKINLLLYQQKGGRKKRKSKSESESKLINIEDELNTNNPENISKLLTEYKLEKNIIYNYINYRSEKLIELKINNESIKIFVNNFVNILYLNKYFPKLNRIYFENVFDFFTENKIFNYLEGEKIIEKIENDYKLTENKEYKEYKEGKKDSNNLIYYIIQYINKNNINKDSVIKKLHFQKKYYKYKRKYLQLIKNLNII